ncbi:MAG: exodeoxyribonuclease VII large subunit [Acidimicrobiaceae bacterium]|nr:exodeoxyribonuclease VII large subunit [Acidimicrobiaceae bacterium]
MAETHTWSVGDLCEAIRDTFTAVFPEEIWIEGEISSLKFHSSGHVYFDLIEPDNSGNHVDKMSVALWKGRRNSVESVLSRADAGPLTEGIKIRIRGELSFYAPQGRVQLLMTAIDPHHTLGQLSIDRERVLQSLSKDGLLETNRSLRLSPVPLHVGLVTSDGSAAYNDFVDEISSSRYPFKISLAHSSVQGTDAEASLITAIQALANTDADVIAVVRGGGARTDLLAFDLENVARAVALAGTPVFSGIGHEIDRSVVDEVAHTAFKTPTACAAALVQTVAAFDQALGDSARRIANLANSCHDRAAALISSSARSINDRARRTLDVKNGQLNAASNRLRDLSLMAIDRNLERCNRNFDLLQALDPSRTLARGFSITRDEHGKVIRDVAPSGVPIITETATSFITSTVTDSASRDAKENR